MGIHVDHQMDGLTRAVAIKERGMRHINVVLVLGVAIGLLGAGTVHDAPRIVAAQEGTPGTTAEPMIVGAWQWNSFPEGGEVCCGPEPASFAIFHADGTYTEWQPVAGTAIGIWRMTGERTYDLLFVFPDTDPSLEGFAPGTGTFTITIELDETGNALTATGTIDVRDAGGCSWLPSRGADRPLA